LEIGSILSLCQTIPLTPALGGIFDLTLSSGRGDFPSVDGWDKGVGTWKIKIQSENLKVVIRKPVL
jgi:hypothetical protein